MADKSAIEWTEATLNAWTGCRKVSAGCAKCYLPRTMPFRSTGRTFVKGVTLDRQGDGPVVYHLDRIDKMVRRQKPTVYFVNSLSDVFLEDVPDEAIALLWAGMACAPQHTFQVLTKRPERMRELLTNDDWWSKVWALAVDRWPRIAREVTAPTLLIDRSWRLTHVWLGVTVENRAQVKRADLLRETPAEVRFLSCEPLLGPLVHDCWRAQGGMLVPGPGYYREGVDEPLVPARSAWSDERPGGPRRPQLDLTGIDWVIAGGESGPDPRPCREGWLRDLRDACLVLSDVCERCGGFGRLDPMGGPAHHVAEEATTPCGCRPAFFLKQLGGHPDKRGGDKAILDGRLWHEMPPVHLPEPEQGSLLP